MTYKGNKTPTAIETVSGSYFDVLEPDATVLTIEDIAHALSNQCRFGGHVKKFYSVAEHAAWVCILLREYYRTSLTIQKLGHGHDDSEAVLVDIPTPIKKLLTNYYELESNVMDEFLAVMRGLNIKFSDMPKEVILADIHMLSQEAYDLVKSRGLNWLMFQKNRPPKLKKYRPMCLRPSQAKRFYLREYYRLEGDKKQFMKYTMMYYLGKILPI